MSESTSVLRIMSRNFLFITILGASLNNSLYASDNPEIYLEVGESYYLKLSDPKRIAVGNSQIVQASATGQEGVIIFGKNRGITSVNVWLASGRHESLIVKVVSGGFEQNFRLIKRLLEDVAQAKVSKVQDRIVIEGTNLSDQDRARVAQIVTRYPDTLDLTSTIGWDKMVLLDVQVIELPSSRVLELGLRWNASSIGNAYGGGAWNDGDAAGSRRSEEIMQSISSTSQKIAGVLGVSALLNARISALSQSGEAVILAQPQLLTRSGSTANFLAGGEVPYSTTDKDGRTNTIFKKYGIELNITPQADSSGIVRSRIDIEVSSVDPTINLPSGPALRVRKASTEFNVRSGQTLVLGGFLSREKSMDREGFPKLIEIPVLGGIFGATRKIERQTELAILVTPNIIDPSSVARDYQAENTKLLLKDAFSTPLQLNSGIEKFVHPDDQYASEAHGDQWATQ